ncbi:hypothetical protein HRG_014398 [Hirsutella rhossiliensis]
MAARNSFYIAPGLVLLLAVLGSYTYGTSLRRMTLVLGVFRTPASQDSIQPKDVSIIGNTLHCEDLHYHEASKLLFTACEDVESTRYSWFPPLANFNNPTAASKARGNIRIIDPRTLKARALHFENFEPPFVTHGIDIIDDPSRRKGEAVYVFAVNHKPSHLYYEAKWSTTLYVEFSASAGSPTDDSYNVKASVALAGTFEGMDSNSTARRIDVVESIELDSTLDNPSYFSDPFANATFDASGFIVCGLTRAVDLQKNSRDPHAKDGVMVWKVAPHGPHGQQTSNARNDVGLGGWSKRLLFQDDGNRIRSSSTAVLVATDPSINGGRRRAQLFVTGFLSKSIVSIGVDL